MQRSIRAALAALALTMVIAAPALAAKPFVETFDDSGTFEIPCGTVTLVEDYRLSVRVTSWLDANGDMARGQARVRWEGTITGPGSTLELSDDSRYTSFIDFGPDGPTERDIGLQFKFSAPGLGIVAHSVGLLKVHPDGTVEVKGPHEVSEENLGSVICPLFT